ncbi:uncharacterized protein LOC133140504 [Conger conger]|uniref:uncharacterized protein LOC133140504 n=1 Tax=Conger conger TaxID=82655 RepID=UPI002A5A401C|nr:uncharacterized protein LOC133140504 [Conger conger]
MSLNYIILGGREATIPLTYRRLIQEWDLMFNQVGTPDISFILAKDGVDTDQPVWDATRMYKPKTSFDASLRSPLLVPGSQYRRALVSIDGDYCADGECGQCQDAYTHSSPSIRASQDEGIHTFLTLQTAESCDVPIQHSVNISHSAAPLLLSHCVSLGVTTVAVDVHYYPPHSASSTFTSAALELGDGSPLPQRQGYDQAAPKMHYVQRTCL